MYTVWHVDKYKITLKLVINHWTNEVFLAYRSFLRPTSHIHQYYSSQNISTIKYLFMKNV